MNPSEIALAALKAWEDRDVARADSLLADDFTISGVSPAPLGKPAYLAFQSVHNAAFADWKFNPSSVQVDGDTATINIQISATHTGTYDVTPLGLPVPPLAASGKHRSWPKEQLVITAREGQVSKILVHSQPEGGLIGTLAWLGVTLPAPQP